MAYNSFDITDFSLKYRQPYYGQTIIIDTWKGDNFTQIIKPDSFDFEYFNNGSEENLYRVLTHNGYIPTLPVKIFITGRKAIKENKHDSFYTIKIKIEFLRDGEESQFTTGKLVLPEFLE